MAALSSCDKGERPAASIQPDSVRADSTARARQDSINRTLPGYVVDSILPVAEELRRFRAAVGGDSVAALTGGAPSREGLVAKFISALESSDTVALAGMQLSAPEFGWLVYPESPYTRPPYTQAPGLVWGQIQNKGSSGLVRLLRRLAGHRLVYTGYSCAAKPERQGRNLLWLNCAVRIGNGNRVQPHSLFGSIIERDGEFKFVSYANEF